MEIMVKWLRLKVVEASDESLGGSAEKEGGQLNCDVMSMGIPREAVAKATADDPSLQLARQLATNKKQGYVFKEGLLMRKTLDALGDSRPHLCLPKAYRERCMQLAHTRFGHMGRNKMISAIRPHFYWPRLSHDCAEFIRGCIECQAYDKTNPPRGLMQMREIVSIPFERVGVDLVGPFPTATGGYRFP